MKQESIDVAVIGGGPAGISACLELAKSSRAKVELFTSDSEIGGIPRSGHLFFGMRDLRRIYTGPRYVQRLTGLLYNTSVGIHANATVLSISPGASRQGHVIKIVSPEGLQSYTARFIVLATGCCESSREARRIPGTRPAGIYTTGALQDMVSLRGLTPGRRALVIGSEYVALACILTLRRAGMSIAGLVEEGHQLQTRFYLAEAMSLAFRFPIYKGTIVKAVKGQKRVEGVELEAMNGGETRLVACDTMVVTGRFRPVTDLIDNTAIEQDPSTGRPLVDEALMTSIQDIYAAGNIVRCGDMHDLCALDGRHVGRQIRNML